MKLDVNVTVKSVNDFTAHSRRKSEIKRVVNLKKLFFQNANLKKCKNYQICTNCTNDFQVPLKRRLLPS